MARRSHLTRSTRRRRIAETLEPRNLLAGGNLLAGDNLIADDWGPQPEVRPVDLLEVGKPADPTWLIPMADDDAPAAPIELEADDAAERSRSTKDLDQQNRSLSSGASASASLQLGRWIEQGPHGAHLPQNIERLGPSNTISGATHTVVAHPTDADILYIGAVNGGIWKTENATDLVPLWTPQTDALGSLNIGALAFDPTDSESQTLVATTARYSSYGGVGGDRGQVFRTTDGGDTWINPGSGGLFGENLSGVAARGDNIVVTSTTSGGIFRSTNAGVSFTVVEDADFEDNDNFSDLVEDPSDVNRLYAVNTGENGAGGPGGVYRSDDFGVTWQKITGPTLEETMDDFLGDANNVEMAVSPVTGRLFVAILVRSQPVAIYYSDDATGTAPSWTRMDVPVLPQGPANDIDNVISGATTQIVSANHGLANNEFVVIDGVGGVDAANGFHRVVVVNANTFRLDGVASTGSYAGGGTWTQVVGANPTPKDVDEAGNQGRIHFSITADPDDENLIYLGGDRQDFPNTIGATTFSGSIFRGDTRLPSNRNIAPSPQWDHLTNLPTAEDPTAGTALNSSPHADSREMVFDVLGNLIEVDDGGVYKRTSPKDNTGDWFSLIGNLAVSETHDVAYDSLSNTLIAGLQDNGTLFQPTDGATFWDMLSSGDGGDVLVDNVTLADQSQSIRYTSFQNLGSFRRTVWDASGQLLSTTFPALNVTSGPNFSPVFDTTVAINRVAPERLLFGMSNGLYESLDQGDTLQRVSTLAATNTTLGDAIDYGGRSGGVDVPGVFYASNSSGTITVRTDTGSFNTNDPGATAIADVIMDRENWMRGWAIDRNQVFQTLDGGVTWTDVTGNLSSIRPGDFRALEFVPGTTNALVLGTNQGVFALDPDSTSDWFEVGQDLPGAVVFDLQYNATDDLLIAGTMGRGVWTLENASRLFSPNEGMIDVRTNEAGFLQIVDRTGDFSDGLKVVIDHDQEIIRLLGFGAVFNSSVGGSFGSGTNELVLALPVDTPFIEIDSGGGRDSIEIEVVGEGVLFDVFVNSNGLTDGTADRLMITTPQVNRVDAEFLDDVAGFLFVVGAENQDVLNVTFDGTERLVFDGDSRSTSVVYGPDAQRLVMSPTGPELDAISLGATGGVEFQFTQPSDEFYVVTGDPFDPLAPASELDDLTLFGTFDFGETLVGIQTGRVTLNGAGIFHTGDGSIEILASERISMRTNSRIVIADGDVLLDANLLGRDGDFDGIFMDDSIIEAETGSIVLLGVGGNQTGGSFNRGVVMFDSQIRSTGVGPDLGEIFIDGTGGDAATSNRGIQISGATSRIETVDAEVDLIGRGGANATDSFNQGIIIFEGTVESLGTGPNAGTISLEGFGGGGLDQNNGIVLLNSDAAVRSRDGLISIEGTAGGTNDFNIGVQMLGGSQVESTGTGPLASGIEIIGTGSASDFVSRGIEFSSPATRVTSVDGDVVIDGTGGDTPGGFNQGILFFDGIVQTTGDGDLTMTGTAAGATGQGIFIQGVSAVRAAGTGDANITATGIGGFTDLVFTGGVDVQIGDPAAPGDLRITADNLFIDGVSSISGAGNLFVQPLTAGTEIGIGSGAGLFQLNNVELNTFADGFSSISIGDADSGIVEAFGATFRDDLLLTGNEILIDSLDVGLSAATLTAISGTIQDVADGVDVSAGQLTLVGTVTPRGPGIGTLSTSGGGVLASGTTLQLQAGGAGSTDQDRLQFGDDLIIEPEVSLDVIEALGYAASIAAGDQITLIELSDPAATVTGTFDLLPMAGKIPGIFGTAFDAVIDYAGGDGNDIVLAIVTAAPEVLNVRLNEGGPSRSQITSVSIQFDEEIETENLADAITLQNVSTTELVDSLIVTPRLDDQNRSVIDITFDAGTSVLTRAGTGLLGNTLATGEYLLEIDETQIRSVASNQLLADPFVFGDAPEDEFFRKYGDENGDNSVDLLDFAEFRVTFGQRDGDPGFLAGLDSQGDGVINLFDFADFRTSFGT
ncbi:MAG: hypothetical protein AAF958_05430 [Planctomycetota bacterium]